MRLQLYNIKVKMCSALSFIGKLFLSIQNLVFTLLKNSRNKNKDIIKFPQSNISSLKVTENILLFVQGEKKYSITDLYTQEEGKHLVVLICWLEAKEKYTHKYAEIWIERGFDVLSIYFNAWELLLPVQGTQVVAADILKFLDNQKSYSQIMIHGFSAGGYLWGEVMLQMAQNIDRYQHILDIIVGQIWDSLADVDEVPVGVSKAIFPKNKFFANAVQKYMRFHLRLFENINTKYYRASSKMFHMNVVQAPALVVSSKTDPIAPESTNRLVIEDWEKIGIKVTWKLFDKSPHVGHFRKHPKEYIAQMDAFLDDLRLTKQTRRTHNDNEAEENKS